MLIDKVVRYKENPAVAGLAVNDELQVFSGDPRRFASFLDERLHDFIPLLKRDEALLESFVLFRSEKIFHIFFLRHRDLLDELFLL